MPPYLMNLSYNMEDQTVITIASDVQLSQKPGFFQTIKSAYHSIFPEKSPFKRRNGPMPGRSSLCLHPIIEMIRDQELGKSVFNLGAPITVALLITKGGGKSHTVLDYSVLTGLLAGCVAIWNGISFRATFPHAANVVEQLGIIMVLMSFNGLVGSALPVDLTWVPVLCGGLSVLPFVVAALTPPSSEETTAVDNC